ncbi:cell envelope integrity protein TolA [Rheinheimera sp. WS51]|uniref:cell envelope integrity protein TolA n=1 Tax=Rheinheimera sp. WS51 TaxID=3425886 RepID=UPI003D89BD9E
MLNKIDPALAKSLGLHLVCIILLVWGADFSSKPEVVNVRLDTLAEDQAPVAAVAIDADALEQRVAQIEQEKANEKAKEERRIRDLERRAQLAEKNRADEEARLKQVAEQKRKADAEAKAAQVAAANAKKQQQEEAEKAKLAEQARIEKEQERKKAEAAAKAAAEKRKQEQEALEKQRQERARKEAEAKRQAEQERLMQEQLAKEASARAAARSRQAATEVERYKALISNTVNQNLYKDESMRGKSCSINIRLATTGFVTSTNVLGGDRVVCDAAVRALNRINKLPMSSDPDVYKELKDITLRVEPEF